MTLPVEFLTTPDVVEEVIQLMEKSDTCHDLPAHIIKLSEEVRSRATGQPFRTFQGPSGTTYPVFITDDEPYVVFAVLNRQAGPQIQVLMAGLRNKEKSSTFFRTIGAEVERRVAVQGWKL